LVYGIAPAVLAILLFASLRLKPAGQITAASCCVALAASAYGVEAFLRASGPALSVARILAAPANKRGQMAAKLSVRVGFEIDTRERHEVIADLRTQGIEAVPLIAEPATNTDLLPLAGISDKTTVVCNQTGRYLIYTSDEHGFHNPHGVWQPGRVDIAAVGNSFTLGTCVPSEKNFVSLMRRRYPATVNLGMVGESPLHILAVLKEYALFLRPTLVLWFYAEGSSLAELQQAKQNHVLMNYLADDFMQGLLARQAESDRVLTQDIGRQTALEINRQEGTRGRDGKGVDNAAEFLKLTALRQELGMVYGTGPQDLEVLSEVERSNLETDLALLRGILSEAKARVGAWGGTLYFVYLPGWQRHAQYPEIGVKARMQVLAAVTSLGIPVIDVFPAFLAHGDPLSLFPFRGPGHYNEEGHRVVAEAVLTDLSRRYPNGFTPGPGSDAAEG
jgi:hypothetical protein